MGGVPLFAWLFRSADPKSNGQVSNSTQAAPHRPPQGDFPIVAVSPKAGEGGGDL